MLTILYTYRSIEKRLKIFQNECFIFMVVFWDIFVSIMFLCIFHLYYNKLLLTGKKKEKSFVTWRYSWPLNNMGFNYAGPFIDRYVSIVNTTVLHNPWLVESQDLELLQGWRAGYKLQVDYLRVAQGLTVIDL